MTVTSTLAPSPTTRTNRSLIAAAATAACGFVGLAVAQLVFPEQGEPAFVRVTDYIIEASYVLALWASVVAIWRLVGAASAHPGFGRLGRSFGGIYAAGHLALAVATTATLVQGHDTLGPVFLVGLLGWFVGGMGLAAGLIRSRCLPVPLAVLFAMSLPVTMAAGHAGPVVAGALWGCVALVAARGRP